MGRQCIWCREHASHEITHQSNTEIPHSVLLWTNYESTRQVLQLSSIRPPGNKSTSLAGTAQKKNPFTVISGLKQKLWQVFHSQKKLVRNDTWA